MILCSGYEIGIPRWCNCKCKAKCKLTKIPNPKSKILSPLSKGKSSNVPNESKVLLPAKQKITGDANNVIDDIRINLKLLWMG